MITLVYSQFVIIGMAATHFLPGLVGPSTAASLLLTGKIIGAEEARDSGLVSKVYIKLGEQYRSVRCP